MRAAELMVAAVWLSVASAVSLWLAYGGLNQVTDPARWHSGSVKRTFTCSIVIRYRDPIDRRGDEQALP